MGSRILSHLPWGDVMHKIFATILMVLLPTLGWTSDITWPNLSTGDQFTATMANDIKAAVNSKADTTYVDTVVAGKQDADANLPTWPAAVDATEVGYLNGVTSAIQTQIDGKEDALGNPSTSGYVLSSTDAGVRSWIQNGAGAMVYPGAGVPQSTGSAWGDSLTLDTDIISGVAGDDSEIPTSDAVADALALKADKTNTAFTAGVLADLKITLTDASTSPLVDGTVAYGDTDDHLRVPTVESTGALLAGKSDEVYSGTIELNTTTVANAGVIASGSSQLLASAITATGVLAASDGVDIKFIGDPYTKTGFAPSTDGGLYLYGFVSADNAIQVRVVNNTASSITLDSSGSGATIKLTVTR